MRRRRLASILTSASLLGASLGFAGVDQPPLLEAPPRLEAYDQTPGFVRAQTDHGFTVGVGASARGGQARIGMERRIASLPRRLGTLSAGAIANLAPESVGIGAELNWAVRWRPDQFLLPRIGYRFEQAWRSGALSGTELGAGPVLGLGLLLSQIDEASAVDFYLQTAVIRTYLMGELSLVSAVPAGTLNLRFEY